MRSGPPRHCRPAYYQVRAETFVLDHRIVLVAFDFRDEALRRVASDLAGVLPRGGERRPGLLGKGAVLEPRDGQLPGHVDATRARRREYARSTPQLKKSLSGTLLETIYLLL